MSNQPITIDAHQHFWDLDRFDYPWMTPDLTVLRRNYLPQDLRPQLDRAGIDRTVFVQALHDVAETEWVLELAETHSWIAGVVGWVDLKSPRLEEVLEQLTANVKFVGVRHMVQDEPDDRWLLDDAVIRSLHLLAKYGLTYDLLLRPRHLPLIPELVRRVPELQMVIDHLAKPQISQKQLEPWRTDLAQVARLPGIYCKISGMITEADHQTWKASDLAPFVNAVLELFGPARLMFGSDWPVCRLAGEYGDVLAAVNYGLSHLSPAERAAVFGGTAMEFYQLEVA